MAAKLTRLAHKIAIQLHLVAESCTICSSRSRRKVRKLLDIPSYFETLVSYHITTWRHNPYIAVCFSNSCTDNSCKGKLIFRNYFTCMLLLNLCSFHNVHNIFLFIFCVTFLIFLLNSMG